MNNRIAIAGASVLAIAALAAWFFTQPHDAGRMTKAEARRAALVERRAARARAEAEAAARAALAPPPIAAAAPPLPPVKWAPVELEPGRTTLAPADWSCGKRADGDGYTCKGAAAMPLLFVGFQVLKAAPGVKPDPQSILADYEARIGAYLGQQQTLAPPATQARDNSTTLSAIFDHKDDKGAEVRSWRWYTLTNDAGAPMLTRRFFVAARADADKPETLALAAGAGPDGPPPPPPEPAPAEAAPELPAAEAAGELPPPPQAVADAPAEPAPPAPIEAPPPPPVAEAPPVAEPVAEIPAPVEPPPPPANPAEAARAVETEPLPAPEPAAPLPVEASLDMAGFFTLGLPAGWSCQPGPAPDSWACAGQGAARLTVLVRPLQGADGPFDTAAYFGVLPGRYPDAGFERTSVEMSESAAGARILHLVQASPTQIEHVWHSLTGLEGGHVLLAGLALDLPAEAAGDEASRALVATLDRQVARLARGAASPAAFAGGEPATLRQLMAP